MPGERTGMGDTPAQVTAFRVERAVLFGYVDAAHRVTVERVAKLTPTQFMQSIVSYASLSFFKPAVPRPPPQKTPETPSDPIRICRSRLRIAAPRLAARRCGRLRLRAGAADIVGGRRWDAQRCFLGLCAGRAGDKMPFEIPIRV
jgi:hypothetical protein